MATDLLPAVLAPTDAIKRKHKLSTDEYAAWLNECSDKFEADMLIAAPKGDAKKLADAAKDKSVIFKRNVMSCRRTSDMLVQSLKSKQMQTVSNLFQCNAHEMWGVMCNVWVGKHNRHNIIITITIA